MRSYCLCVSLVYFLQPTTVSSVITFYCASNSCVHVAYGHCKSILFVRIFAAKTLILVQEFDLWLWLFSTLLFSGAYGTFCCNKRVRNDTRLSIESWKSISNVSWLFVISYNDNLPKKLFVEDSIFATSTCFACRLNCFSSVCID